MDINILVRILPEGLQNVLPDIIQLLYLLASVLFILGIKKLSSPTTARKGNQLAAMGMLLGIVVTIFNKNILSFEYILAGIVVGSLIGWVAAKKVAMTAMPEMVAIFNGFGGGASALVAWGELARTNPGMFGNQELITIGVSIFIGSLTFTGSYIAFGKLKGFISGNPITFPGHNILNMLMMAGIVVLIALFTMDPVLGTVFWIMLGLSLFIGIMMVIPIGGADMPVVISLLNSFSGIAASATGFVLNNNLLIISGALVGAAGLILTDIMCKSMNRTLPNVLFGAFGGTKGAAKGGDTDKTVRETSADDVAILA